MKKILTASLVAMMAVTAANADIASTQYVNKKLTGDAENGTLSFTGAAADQTTLQGAVNAIADSLSTSLGAGGNVETQIKTAVEGLDVAEITVADGKYVKTVSETDGKVSVTTGDLVAQISGDAESSLVAPTTAAVTGYVQNKLDVMTNNVDTLSGNLTTLTKRVAGAEGDISAAEGRIGTLETKSATKEELDAQKTTLTGDIATAKSEAIAAAKTETEGQVSAAKDSLQGQIDALNNGENSVSKQIDNKIGTLANGATNVATAIENAQAAAATDAATKANAAQAAAEATAKTYTDNQLENYTDTTGMNTAITNKVNTLDAEAEVVGTNDGSYVTAVAQTDGKIKVSTVAFDTALNADSTNAVQNKVVNTAIEGIKTNLGGLSGKNIANVPTSCAEGGSGTCSLVMKNGVATWEVVEY